MIEERSASHAPAPDAFSRRHPHFRAYLVLFLAAWAFTGLTRARAFTAEHREGDETVYLTLAREMGWDLSHYTTRDDPEVSRYPYATYRHPLFIHPPLYPLVLKAGSVVGRPVAAGLLFGILSLGLLLAYAWRAMVLLGVPPRWGVAAFLGVAACPLLLFSTSRLHIDGLAAIWLVCGVVATMEALDARSPGRAVLAGALLVVAMNLRYSGIVALPLVLLVQGYHLHRLARREAPPAPDVRTALRRLGWSDPYWRVLAVILALVVTLGLQHYYRVLDTFGTLLPGAITVPDPDVAAFSPFLRIVLERGRAITLLYFAMIFPIVAIFATGIPYRVAIRSFRTGGWAPVLLLAFLILLATTVAFTHTQMRYYAAVTPALYLYLPVVLDGASPRERAGLVGLGAVTLWLMVTTGFLWTTVFDQSAAILPSLYYYAPWLEPLFDLVG